MSRTAIKKIIPSAAAPLADRVEEVFGRGAPADMVGLFCLVHLDRPKAEVRRKRVEEFTPEMIFDKNCPHCTPFLEAGAYILFTKDGPFGLRLLPNNTYEMVGLTPSGQMPLPPVTKTRQ